MNFKKLTCLVLVLLIFTLLFQGCFKEEIKSQDSGVSKTVSDEVSSTATIDPSPVGLLLAGEDLPELKLVRNISSKVATSELIGELAAYMLSEYEVHVSLKSDENYNSDTVEIVFGKTVYPESESVYQELDYNSYSIQIVGNKLVVAAYSEAGLGKAIEKLKTILKKNIQEGNLYFPTDGGITMTYSTFFIDFPNYQGGDPGELFNCGDNVLEILYSDATAQTTLQYIELLKKHNFQVIAENKIGENAFYTLTGNGGVLNLSFDPSISSLRVISSKENNTILPVWETDYNPTTDRVTDCTLCALGLNTEYSNDNGMGYVLTLEDGRYIIWDGGLDTDTDSLWDYLRGNNKRRDGKIVIAAWIITHAHGDHYGNFRKFSTEYADQVTLQYAIANGASKEMFREGLDVWDDYLGKQFFVDARRFEGVQIIKPHSGQKFRFCNVEIEVLFTHEDMYPTKIYDPNEQSTVTRVTYGEQTILFTGDALSTATDVMMRRYGSLLKSDILQVNHHGSYHGMKADFHRFVNPDVAIYSTNQAGYSSYKEYDVNVVLAGLVDEIIVVGDRNRILKLPYYTNS